MVNNLSISAAQHSTGSSFSAIIRSLRHRNFRLFFSGQSISLIGSWMQGVALSWLVYRLTHSAFLLGVTGFSSQIPAFFLSPVAGVLADRWNRHLLIIMTQTLAMVQASILSILVLTHTITIWEIIALSMFLGVITAFDIPIRQSFMIEMIEDKKDLGNAIALNSTMFNGARLLGPSVAGLLIAAVGEGMCFLLNAVSYLAVIASLLLMKIPHSETRSAFAHGRVWQEIKEGFNYAAGFGPIRTILLMLALIGLMGMPYSVLMPAFAKDILHGNSNTFGFLMGSAGLGALFGAVYLASRKTVVGLGKMIPIAAAVFGIGLIGLCFCRNFAFALGLMALTGFGQIVQMASSNTLLQTIVENDKRGRIMSFYTIAFMGMTPIGSLLAGSLASHVGTPWTLCVGGIACLMGAAGFALKLPKLRKDVLPVYIHKNIWKSPDSDKTG